MNKKTVSDLQDSKYVLVTDSQEIAAVFESIGGNEDCCAGCLFVEVQRAYYGEIWACESAVPYFNSPVYQIR